MSAPVNEKTPLFIGNSSISYDEEKGEGRERTGSHASLSDHKGKRYSRSLIEHNAEMYTNVVLQGLLECWDPLPLLSTH